MTTVNGWAGAQTPTGFRVVAVVTGASPRLAVSLTEEMDAPVYFAATSVDAQGAAKFTASGLTAGTRYWWAVETNGAIDTAWVGTVKTAPATGPASFTFAVSSCAGHANGPTDFWPPASGITGVSNHAVFDTIRAHEPEFFVHTGDMFYRDPNTNDPAPFRQGWNDVLTAPRQAALYRSTGLVYIADDHDGGPDNRDRTAISATAYKQAYRERIPSHPLPDPSGLWHTWAYGRVRFILTDCRTERDPLADTDDANKNMLGATQEQWLYDTLTAATEPVIVWISSLTWIGPAFAGGDAWMGYSTERARIGKFITDRGLGHRMVILTGDSHANGMDDGRNNLWGGFPELCFSPLDSDPGSLPGGWSHGVIAGRGQYGVIHVEDTDEVITLTATAYQNTTAQRTLVMPRRVTPLRLVKVDDTKTEVAGVLKSVKVRTLGTVNTQPASIWAARPPS